MRTLPAIGNAVVDALARLGVRHVDIPITPENVWMILREKGWWAKGRGAFPGAQRPPG